MALRSKMRTFVKKVIRAIEEKDPATAKTAFNEAVPVIDTMVSKGIIHKNNAARKKSRLHKQVKQLDQQAS